MDGRPSVSRDEWPAPTSPPRLRRSQAYSIGRAALSWPFDLSARDREAGLVGAPYELVCGTVLIDIGTPSHVDGATVMARLRTRETAVDAAEQLAQAPEEGGVVLTSDVVDEVQGDDRRRRS